MQKQNYVRPLYVGGTLHADSGEEPAVRHATMARLLQLKWTFSVLPMSPDGCYQDNGVELLVLD